MSTENYTATAQEALQAGFRNLRYAPLALFVLGCVLGVAGLLGMAQAGGKPQTLAVVVLFLCPLTGLVLGAAYRATFVVAWKIQALETVRDVHYLYHLARFYQMIPLTDFGQNFLQWASKEQKQHLAALETRLQAPRQWDPDDPTVPDALEYPFSPWLLVAPMGAFLLFGCFVLLDEYEKNPWVLLLGLLAAGGIIVYTWWRQTHQPPPLRLDSTGIYHKNNPVVSWAEVTDIYPERRQQGRAQVAYLRVETLTRPGRDAFAWNLSFVSGRSAEIEHACYTLWVRWRKSSGLTA